MTTRSLSSRTARYSLLALLGALVLLISQVAMAQTEVSLQLVSVGGTSGGVNVYPYNLSVNGGGGTTPMLCDTYTNDISIGESWKANAYNFSYLLTSNPLPTLFNSLAGYEEAAWLMEQMAGGKSWATPAAVNYAIWGIFDPALVGTSNYTGSGAATAISDLPSLQNLSSDATSGDFNNVTVYTPIAGTQSSGGTAQEFLTITPVPEPGTLALIGSGLFGAWGFIRRKKLF